MTTLVFNLILLNIYVFYTSENTATWLILLLSVFGIIKLDSILDSGPLSSIGNRLPHLEDDFKGRQEHLVQTFFVFRTAFYGALEVVL